MSQRINLPPVVPGTIVEFFEARNILLGVCLATKSQRMTVLAENSREFNLARSRILHASSKPLDPNLSRENLIARLLQIKEIRETLRQRIDTVELWSLLEGEAEGFDALTLAQMVFAEAVSDHHVAAMQRVLLADRLYFQFKDGLFYARPEEAVRQRQEQLRREEERETLLKLGAGWLEGIYHRKATARNAAARCDTALVDATYRDRIIENLKNFALFGQEADDLKFVKELLKRANIPPQPSAAFRLLVRLGIWHEDENTYLHQLGIPVEFPATTVELAERYRAEMGERIVELAAERGHQDLRSLEAFTIDSALTRDFDDALSFRTLQSGRYEVGVHIADVAAFVQPDDAIDQEARCRASSVYLPDQRIPMLPAALSEDLCSLLLDQDRLAISFLFELDENRAMVSKRIVPSLIRVRNRLTYEDFDQQMEKDDAFIRLYELSVKLRGERLEAGAVILPLPEVQVYVNDSGMIRLHRHLKETPSQVVVSEWMIAANRFAAEFLSQRDIPAVFRCQAECKPETHPTMSEHPLFHIYRQKRLFARAELDLEPQRHCSLGVPHYTSITSPIRRFVDLVTQRQLKHVLETGKPFYNEEQLQQIITEFRSYVGKVGFVQRKWNRYWLLKYLEQEDIQHTTALVLDTNNRFAHLLLPDFLLETNMPVNEEAKVKPGELIRIRIEHLNPREDTMRIKLNHKPAPRMDT